MPMPHSTKSLDQAHAVNLAADPPVRRESPPYFWRMWWKVMAIVLALVAVAVWWPRERVWALGLLVILALVGLISAAIWIHKRRHPEADEMDETTEILQDLREAAAWLLGFWP